MQGHIQTIQSKENRDKAEGEAARIKHDEIITCPPSVQLMPTLAMHWHYS
jgi:hypothetical protein